MIVIRKYLVRVFGGLVALLHTCSLIIAARPVKSLTDRPVEESTFVKRGWQVATKTPLESLGIVGFLGAVSVTIVALLITFGDLVKMDVVQGAFIRWGGTGISLIDDFLMALALELFLVAYGIICFSLFSLLLRLVYSVSFARTLRFSSYWSCTMYLTFLVMAWGILALSAIPVGPFNFLNMQLGLGEIIGLVLTLTFTGYMFLVQPPLYWSRTLGARMAPVAALHLLSLGTLFGAVIAVDFMYEPTGYDPGEIDEEVTPAPDENGDIEEVVVSSSNNYDEEPEQSQLNVIYLPDLEVARLARETGLSEEQCRAVYEAADGNYEVALEELKRVLSRAQPAQHD